MPKFFERENGHAVVDGGRGDRTVLDVRLQSVSKDTVSRITDKVVEEMQA